MDYRLPLIILFGASIQLAACSDDNSSSSTIPPNAIVLNESNAVVTTSGGSAIGQLIVALIEGTVEIGTGSCMTGSATDNGTMTTNGSVTTWSGTVSATNCEVDNGVFINGSASYNFTEDSNTGAETASVTGGLSFNGNGITASITNINFSETSDGMGNYSTNNFSFTVDSSAGDGFAVQLTQPLIGMDSSFPDCPTTGAVLISGSQGTQVRASMVSMGTQVRIELNDGSGFADIMGSPVACQLIF